jgi:hypothetical protein
VRRYVSLLTTLLITLSACRSGPEPGPAGLNMLVEVKGTVEINRHSWARNVYQPALFGMTVESGDLLRTGADGSVMVVCADLTVAGVNPDFIGGMPCQGPSPILVRRQGLVSEVRSTTADTSIPFIISPRRTRLLDDSPLLKWNEVANVVTYTVTIRGTSMRWSQEVTGTQIRYPDSAPELIPGKAYKLIVTADGRSSEEENAPGLGFIILTPEEVRPIREAEAKIRGLELSEEAKDFLVAQLYASRREGETDDVEQGLNAEAVEILEGMAITSMNPVVFRTLGDLYLALGLERLAEERYLRAVELSAELGDVEGQAVASAGLGQIYANLGNQDQAIRRWQEATEQYQALGDREQAEQMEDHIKALRP